MEQKGIDFSARDRVAVRDQGTTTMMGKLKMVFTVALLILGIAGVAPASQAAKEEKSSSGTLAAPQYPGSVEDPLAAEGLEEHGIPANKTKTIYTKDPFDKVKAFYEQKLRVSLSITEGSATHCNVANDRECVRIFSKPENRAKAFDMIEEHRGMTTVRDRVTKGVDEHGGMHERDRRLTGLGSNEFHAACKKYEYLERSFFFLSKETDGASKHLETPDALYKKYVSPVDEQIRVENEQHSASHKEWRKSQEEQKKEKEERKKKWEERQKINKQIKQLKSEGRDEEARALSMKMAQEVMEETAGSRAETSNLMEQQTKQDEKRQQAAG